jgi:hypothetical protein
MKEQIGRFRPHARPKRRDLLGTCQSTPRTVTKQKAIASDAQASQIVGTLGPISSSSGLLTTAPQGITVPLLSGSVMALTPSSAVVLPLNATAYFAGNQTGFNLVEWSEFYSAFTGAMQSRVEKIIFRLPRKSARERFIELLMAWKSETDHVSRLDVVYLNQHYQQIIGMGEDALPFIFNELRTNSGRWFWALKAITQFEPFAGQRAVPVETMRQAWLQWATENEYA